MGRPDPPGSVEGLPPPFWQPPGRRELELRLQAEFQFRYRRADRLLLPIDCSVCGVGREAASFVHSLNSQRRELRPGDSLLLPRRTPFLDHAPALDIIDGVIEGSAFCTTCWTRRLARFTIQARRIAGAGVLPPSHGLAPVKHIITARTGCPRCGADTEVVSQVTWDTTADVARLRRRSVRRPVTYLEVSDFAPPCTCAAAAGTRSIHAAGSVATAWRSCGWCAMAGCWPPCRWRTSARLIGTTGCWPGADVSRNACCAASSSRTLADSGPGRLVLTRLARGTGAHN